MISYILSTSGQKFCEKCGKKLKNAKFKKYDPESGKKVFLMLCPSGLCSCNGHDIEVKKGFWKDTHICRNCDYRETYSNGDGYWE